MELEVFNELLNFYHICHCPFFCGF